MYECGSCACFCLCACVRVCAHLAHLPPVCDASDRGDNPELQTTSRRGSARGNEAPAGGRRWEKYPSKLEWWYSHAKPLDTLSQHFSLRLLYRTRRWEDMQRASLTPKANGCEFPRCISDALFLRTLSKSLMSVVTFTEPSKGSPRGPHLEKDTDLLCFWLRGPGCAGLQQPGNTVENRWSILFSSVKTSLQRKSASLQEWIYGHDGNCWDLLVSTGLKSCRSTNYSWATFTLQINSYVNGRTVMKTWGWEEDYRALIDHQNFLLTDIKVCFCLLCSVNHRNKNPLFICIDL